MPLWRLTLPDRPFRDENGGGGLLPPSRTSTLASLSQLSLSSWPKKLAPFRSLPLSAAFTWLAILFLLRFLRSNDEREQQINYRALTFAFNGTLVFSALVGFLQMFGFHPEHCLASRRL
jgi:hypothetical protein